MPTLNRFPLLALWAKEAARRIGYTVAESEALGHAYAVLYAIRAAGKPHKKPKEGAPTKPRPKAPPLPVSEIDFGGDRIPVIPRAAGKVGGFVGGEPQTSRSYRSHVIHKFPPGYYKKLEEAFRLVFQTYRPKELNGRLLYELYDGWKKSCGAGRLVDLDKLLAWCDRRTTAH
jgi:hypothetical protein